MTMRYVKLLNESKGKLLLEGISDASSIFDLFNRIESNGNISYDYFDFSLEIENGEFHTVFDFANLEKSHGEGYVLKSGSTSFIIDKYLKESIAENNVRKSDGKLEFEMETKKGVRITILVDLPNHEGV